MAYPYPTIDKPRATTHVCMLPHKMYGINTYSECVAAMQQCRDVAASRYERSGDATQAHFAQLFHNAAVRDELVKVDTGASATSAAGSAYDYYGVCRTLLSEQGRANLWPHARDTTVEQLAQFHGGGHPTARPDAPTMSCIHRADGGYECRGRVAPRSTGHVFPLHRW